MDYTDREYDSPGGESTQEIKGSQVVEIIAIAALVLIFLINAVTLKINGNLTGVLVGAIVYVATKTYYKEKLRQSG